MRERFVVMWFADRHVLSPDSPTHKKTGQVERGWLLRIPHLGSAAVGLWSKRSSFADGFNKYACSQRNYSMDHKM